MEAKTKLDEYLKSHGMSRNRLAQETGLDLRTISAICSGKHEGNLATWKLIAQTLGCKLDEIVEV